ncbi:MAG: riboflavin synthase subunit alpha [Gammaproteobacteria bacterium]|nr:riboflavin synthase subunit alpha [Gammaproteobacteria bacterium]
MFSGIVTASCRVHSIEQKNGVHRLTLDLTDLTHNLEVGGSVAINGVCLTVVAIDDMFVGFEVVQATRNLTNLRFLSSGSLVNVERSIRLGDEIGGQVLSGHIAGVVEVVKAHTSSSESRIEFVVPRLWRKYFHTKGFIALDGVSLTLAEFDCESGLGVVNLIPETLRRTTLSTVSTGTLLNFEVDPTTLAVVDTVERMLQSVSKTMDRPRPQS